MEKEESFMLNQLSISLEEIVENIKKAYSDNNIEELNKLKKLFLQIQEKIIESIK